MKLIFCFVFIMAMLIIGFYGKEDASFLKTKEKRSGILIRDLLKQMLAEHIERKKILDEFGTMKKQFNDLKNELKNRSIQFNDYRERQGKLLQDTKNIHREVKECQELKQSFNDFKKSELKDKNKIFNDIKLLQGKLLRDVKDIKKEVKEALKADVKKEFKEVNITMDSAKNELILKIKKQENHFKGEIMDTKMELTEVRKIQNDTNQYLSDIENRLTAVEKDNAMSKVSFTALKMSSSTNRGVIKFEHVITNNGNGYDKNTGRFTAPSAGVYVFTWTIVTKERQAVDTNIFVNQRLKGRAFSDARESNIMDDSASSTTVVRMEKGHVAEIRVHHSWNTFVDGSRWSSFSGFKIHM